MKRPPLDPSIDSTVARRLDALESLIDLEYEKSTRVFEEKTGIKMAQVSQWFSGYRALRDKALRRLEAATGKPEGWFDIPIMDATGIEIPAFLRMGNPGPTTSHSQIPLDKTNRFIEQLSTAVELLAARINEITDQELIELIASRLQTMARAPDSVKARNGVLEALAWPDAAKEAATNDKTASKPLGAPIAPELVETLQKLSQEAEDNEQGTWIERRKFTRQ